MDDKKMEVREKRRLKTLKNNIPQISNLEERETIININYFDNTFTVYTNNSTVMNRMERRDLKHIKEGLVNGEIYDRTYEFRFDMMPKVVQSTILR